MPLIQASVKLANSKIGYKPETHNLELFFSESSHERCLHTSWDEIFYEFEIMVVDLLGDLIGCSASML
jgi:hypothetical protein